MKGIQSPLNWAAALVILAVVMLVTPTVASLF
jgi:hypothetical protein